MPFAERQRERSIALALGLAAVVVAADRISKHYVRRDIGDSQSRTVVPGVLRLVHYRNTGVAFDFLSGGGGLVLAITVVVLLGLAGWFLAHPTRRGLWAATGLLVGGAVGNLLDRLIDGSVTDFIKLPDWPAFNVADIAITCGVIALVWVVERDGRRT